MEEASFTQPQAAAGAAARAQEAAAAAKAAAARRANDDDQAAVGTEATAAVRWEIASPRIDTQVETAPVGEGDVLRKGGWETGGWVSDLVAGSTSVHEWISTRQPLLQRRV